MSKRAMTQVLEAMFSDIDVDSALDVLKELDLPVAYSKDAVDRVNAEADSLCDVAADLKRNEAPRSERKAVRTQVDRLVNARALLYRLRAARPGDVTVRP